MKKILFLACGAILISAHTMAPAGTQNISKAGSGKLLSDWIKVHLAAVRKGKGLSQGTLFRQFTYTSIAFYEALVGGDGKFTSLNGQLQELEAMPSYNQSKKVHWQAGSSAAMAEMLRKFYKDNETVLTMVDSMEQAAIAHLKKEGLSGEQLQSATSYGKSISDAVLRWADTDGASRSYPAYQAPKGDGMWEPTPPSFAAAAAPYAFNNRTCISRSTENTLPAAPIKFSSDPGSDFYKMVKEVYDASKNISNEERSIALFWDDFPDGRYYGASGHWASILGQVINQRKLSLIEAAQAYATMNIAMMDAFNGCWKAKYHYNMMRPITYIHRVIGDTSWKPLIVTPNHPEYPAAHATISMAAATALTAVLGNNTSFADHSYDDLGYEPRTFKNFIEAGREAGMSRLYGGIHYRPSIEAGYKLGQAIAENVLRSLKMKKA